MKKWLSLAALWLALIALVFIYTDRQEYTYNFGGEDIQYVLLGEEEASAREAAAQTAMDREQEEARARAAANEWGKKNQYGGAPITRKAVDDGLGVNLMWGDYEVTVTYASGEAFDLHVVSAGRQSFIRGGAAQLPAGEQTITFPFTLTDSAAEVLLAGDLPEDAWLGEIVFHKAGAGVFSRDLAAYALLAGVVMTVLLVLSWDTRPMGRERRRDAMVVVFAALFASMPLLWNGVYNGHDLFFHLNRIEGIAAGLRAGQFPVRIHASTLLGHGYAAPQFYPELFLYIPAIMRNLGVSLAACVRVFEISINLLAAASSYFCARKLFGDRRIALGASVLYTLCIYRLVNMYVRATIGESLAMIFFPLLALALYEVLTRDEKKWPLLALAMTGVMMSHLLSTMFSAAMCVAAAVICLPKLIREPKRILACVKAALVMALCSVWFLLPMMDYSGDGISTSVVLPSFTFVLRLGSFLVGYPGEVVALPEEEEDFAYTIGVVPGLAIMLGCALLLIRLYAQGKRADGEENARRDRLSAALLALGGLALLGATEFFPWEWVCNLPRPFSTFFMQMQFPWRLVGIAVPMLSMAAAWGYMSEEKHRTQALFALAALSVVFSAYTMQIFVQRVPLLTQDSYCDTRIEQYEYTYVGTEKSALNPGEVIVAGTDEYVLDNYEKQGTNLSFTLEIPQGCAYVEVPMLYYPGYQAACNGESCRVVRGDNNLIRLYGVHGDGAAQVQIWYEAPMRWVAAQAVSLAGAALLALTLVRMDCPGKPVRRTAGKKARA